EHGAEQDAAEDRAEPLRPPFVDVVDRPMDLLPPALALREPGQELEGEGIGFDEAHPIGLRFFMRWSDRPYPAIDSSVRHARESGDLRSADRRGQETRAERSCVQPKSSETTMGKTLGRL